MDEVVGGLQIRIILVFETVLRNISNQQIVRSANQPIFNPYSFNVFKVRDVIGY